MRASVLILALGVAASAAAPAGGSDAGAAASAPMVDQMVVFPDGRAVRERVSTRRVGVRVRGRRCAAGTATALAALVRSRPARIRLRDFGSCSPRPRDGAGLFVSAIGRYRNRGQDGWVYKVGRRAATAGAADPAGPFGNGRLRTGRRVTWFYCRLGVRSCQRTLALRARREASGIAVTVTGYDDEARGQREAGASVLIGDASQVTDAHGVARFQLPPGSYRAFAEKPGLVRSFSERVVVR